MFTGRADQGLVLEAVDLDNNAVDLEVERVQALDHFVDLFLDFVNRFRVPHAGSDGDSESAEKFEKFRMRGDARGRGVAQAVSEESQSPGGAELGIEKFERARRQVAGIRVDFFTTFDLIGAQACEIRIGDVGFSSDLQAVRQRIF